ncbi:unnamed protein product [Closterium sp. Naga37s-1]|nr:unnamed protein product [Closterium sp. Naga37s-1]
MAADQKVCEIRAFSILIDYVPRRLDLSALSAGNYAHLLNLISWKNKEIDFTKARVVGVQGWDGLGGALIAQWAEDICRRQLHRVVKAAGPGVEIDFTKARVVGVQGWDGLGGALISPWAEYTASFSPHPIPMAGRCRNRFHQGESGGRAGVGWVRGSTHSQWAEDICRRQLHRVVKAAGPGVEIDFTKARVVGVQGWDGLGGALISQWAEDICRRQLHRVVKAAGPVNPLWALGAASLQLVLLPVQEYRQNKRLMRGVKRGVIYFPSSCNNFPPPCPCVLLLPPVTGALAAAQEVLNRSVERSLSSLLGAPLRRWRRGDGMPAVAAAVVKGIPAAAMAPVVGAAEALEETLRVVKRT